MSLGGTDLNLLNALKVLLEEANVTHAGQRLNMSQPAMSGALARLRRQFDDELLVRSGRDYQLTPLAFDLLPLAQESVRLLDQALSVGDRFDPSTSERTFRLTLSDYAFSVLYAPLMRRVRTEAPYIKLEFADLSDDVRASDRGILDYDVLVGPLGYGFPGVSEFFFRDRMVCIVDCHNPALVDGSLTMESLADLPHAVANFGRTNLTPVDRKIHELGVTRRVQVSAAGWFALPFIIEGTDMVAIVPERLARSTGSTEVVAVEPPFGELELIEGFWWQSAKTAEPGQAWLLCLLREVGAELSSAAAVS